MRRFQEAFTLVELLVTVVIMSMALAGIGSAVLFFHNQSKSMTQRIECSAQINNFFMDLRIRTAGATSLISPESFEGDSDNISFTGESDVFQITGKGDNVYEYYICKSGQECLMPSKGGGAVLLGALVLQDVTRNTAMSLVDARYRPELSFSYVPGDNPNMLSVQVKAHVSAMSMGLSKTIEREEKVRFWYINVVDGGV